MTSACTRVHGELRLFEADTIIVCTGQEPLRTVYDALQSGGLRAHLVGGALHAVTGR